MLGWLIAILLTLIGAFYLLTSDALQFAGYSETDRYALVAGVVLMGLLAWSLTTTYAGQIGKAVKYAAVWLAIIIGLVAVYAFREDFSYVGSRVASELLPPGNGIATRDETTGELAVRIRQRSDGQFVARTRVNNANVTMLVDTGASTVVLRPIDAQRAGINTDRLRFTVPVSTANGTTFAAPITIKALAVGPIIIRDVDALVSKPGNLGVSLLGMTFLTRLRSYNFTGNFLTLRS
ncbi:MAG: TIGR02281 family clan AA aspartic protease [Pseudomonadota bacterium]